MIKPQHKNLVYNFSSLTLFQVSNYIFPLITFPYLVRVLGPDKYGLVNFAAAFVMYFSIITDYGFNITATKEISINRENSKKVSEIYSTVLTIKFVLFVICAVIFTGLVFTFSKFNNDVLVYFYTFPFLLGTVLFPTWLFLGLERMKFIAGINIGVKVLWVAAVFIFIQSEEDYLSLVILNSLSQILIGLVSLIVLPLFFNIKFVLPKIDEIKKLLISGWYIFISTASISLYTTSNTFILGIFSSNEVVGYFSAADKLRQAFQNIISSAGQTLFPFLSNLFYSSYSGAVKFIRRYLKIGSALLIAATLIIFISADWIIALALGEQYESSVLIFRIIIFLPLTIFYSNVFGVQILINLNYNKEFTRIVLTAGLLSLFFSFIFVPIYFEVGLSVIMLAIEIFVSLGTIYYVQKKKLFSEKTNRSIPKL